VKGDRRGRRIVKGDRRGEEDCEGRQNGGGVKRKRWRDCTGGAWAAGRTDGARWGALRVPLASCWVCQSRD